jgi:hypothetical protein
MRDPRRDRKQRACERSAHDFPIRDPNRQLRLQL